MSIFSCVNAYYLDIKIKDKNVSYEVNLPKYYVIVIKLISGSVTMPSGSGKHVTLKEDDDDDNKNFQFACTEL